MSILEKSAVPPGLAHVVALLNALVEALDQA
jgi:hypothetical protein